MISAYIIHLLIIIGIFIILTVSLDIVIGYTGMINLGHIAFYGIGAYSSAIMAMRGYPFIVGVLTGMIIAGGCGWLLTVITNKLKGDYFALGTLGFSFVIYAILLNWSSLTKGALGIPGIKKPTILGIEIITNAQYLIFTLVITTIICVFVYLLTKSRYGKLLEAVRDDAIGLAAIGKNVFRLKYQAMAISACLAAIAGALYAHYISYIDPTSFYLNDIIIVLTIVIVGGLTSLRGSILAAVVIVLLPELLRFLNIPSSIIGPARQMLYAALLLTILLFRPQGFFGRIDLK
ncbi:MAG: branched-chain amino acid ABC transporter permease [Candidatus Magasanikbacteria bacterium]|jgi:branched-chain amino acid transport system permease protein|nr:branched-chain amino acid ABC transporter permease [Candidatus Magasanikbacteria bacterium]MBT4221139.1 branched-chain amino acid ABC transporter permease [Candidatus Magasanikbacteria bacterium]MBT4350291.1 branched-chain amino acid ABC transporter permease [Candidatus Magasanikbacteria bacterium]MBT4541717.1 branched-chain amino acid ABC transporter permease [Candidatus Magasanikbacteria bacterium]MBT6253306.1 branched-chain amino acid ABC transporter permease [Candidatus Magasanikbacteria